MTTIPRQVLSEHFQERLAGKQLLAAVFTSYEFDPGFFEQEILPVFLDMTLSHAVPIRLLRLEDGLRRVRDGVAVYYDANGLEISEAGSAQLDVRRIPVSHPTGIFHAKLVFVLTRAEQANQQGEASTSLLVAALSANLTRSGWWRNVEVCHSEEIEQGTRTRLRDDLIEYLESLPPRCAAGTDHGALKAIVAFLREQTELERTRSAQGRLHTHFYGGARSFVAFLKDAGQKFLRDLKLEVISPYFDQEGAKPLAELIKAFNPTEVRVYLPRKADGSAQCPEQFYQAASALDRVCWGHFPADLTRLGKAEDAGERFVHAKVYRFFSSRPKAEYLFVGSVNLTTPAHQNGGNDESGFLVEIDPPRAPDFWLTADTRKPIEFAAQGIDEEPATSGGSSLQVRFDWSSRKGEVFWGQANASPALTVRAQGAEVFVVTALSPRAWNFLDDSRSRRLEEVLASTSLLEVHGEHATPGLILVQEENMGSKPSLLLQLSVADILRYWTQMTEAHRTAFLEQRAPEALLSREGAELVARASRLAMQPSIFDRMAGVYHAFAERERALRKAFAQGNEREVRAMLFGRRIDSLGRLLEELHQEPGRDPVDRYLIYLCARQMCAELRKSELAELWHKGGPDVDYLETMLANAATVRASILDTEPRATEFLDWFDRWFLERAKPLRTTTEEVVL